MATLPASDASSPAVVKVSNQLTTVATASFTPPSNSCIVVGFTSDADNNTGTTPTIANSGTALTWTRVDSTGHGSAGDVGLAALFWAKVVTGAAMTVTVTHNLNGQTANKPKMLVARVYTSADVDVDDPIGVTAKGAFASGTTMTSGTLTPETTAGGLRMLWLDWSATGTPTTFQSNTELVDAYHNAGLSTNVQIGKQTTTTAGVGETIGATLLASSTDGNWIAYEIRGAPPSAVNGYILMETGDRILSESGSDLIVSEDFASGSPTAGAVVGSTASTTTTHLLGKVATAALAATVAIAGAGVVGTSASSTSSSTASISAAGSVSSGISATASLASTDAVSASGAVGASASSTSSSTATLSAAGVVAASTGASRTNTVTVTTAGVVASSTGAASSSTSTITAAGSVTAGISAGATSASTDTITAAGLVASSAGVTRSSTATISASGVVGTSTGASLGVTGTIASAGSALAAGSGTATVASTGTISAAGLVARSTGASLPAIGTISAAGSTAAGPNASASIGATDTITAAGQVSRTSLASITAAAQLLASGSLSVSRTSAISETVTVTAVGIVGDTAGATPPERTLVVAAESRLLEVPAESRVLFAAAESRVLTVPPENRTLEA